LANHKSAIKRDKQNKVRRSINMAYKTRAKSAVKKVRLAIAGNKVEDARLSLNEATSILHKIKSKGIIHRNTANRKISRLTLQVNKIAAISSQENKDEILSSPK